jgi:CubicO group peptidase (beta-lactamase class C family)
MGDIEGLSGAVLVTHADGSVLLREAGGTADAERDLPCTPETRFQIASVSKQFTAAAVMRLVQDGRAPLDAPLSRVMPDCPPRWRDITLHHLLTHTSGLGHWADVDVSVMTGTPTPQEVLDALAARPLHDAPGASYLYSSPGYALLGQLVARLTGQSHASFLRERILAPVGMTSTTTGEDPDSGWARGYRDGERIDVSMYTPLTGCGDMWSTVDDLARWSAAFHGDRVVSAASRKLMCASHVPNRSDDGPVAHDAYGYGLLTGRIAGEEAVYHPGENPGYRSLLAWFPRQGTTAVVLTNDESAPFDEVVRQVAAVATA